MVYQIYGHFFVVYEIFAVNKKGLGPLRAPLLQTKPARQPQKPNLAYGGASKQKTTPPKRTKKTKKNATSMLISTVLRIEPNAVVDALPTGLWFGECGRTFAYLSTYDLERDVVLRYANV
jgi:hypothetical protein